MARNMPELFILPKYLKSLIKVKYRLFMVTILVQIESLWRDSTYSIFKNFFGSRQNGPSYIASSEWGFLE
jgi:hypothetical protein